MHFLWRRSIIKLIDSILEKSHLNSFHCLPWGLKPDSPLGGCPAFFTSVCFLHNRDYLHFKLSNCIWKFKFATSVVYLPRRHCQWRRQRVIVPSLDEVSSFVQSQSQPLAHLNSLFAFLYAPCILRLVARKVRLLGYTFKTGHSRANQYPLLVLISRLQVLDCWV